MDARKAAIRAGWYEVLLNYWCHENFLSVFLGERPMYFNGSARDLCLSQGIDFDEDNAGIV